MELEGHGFRVVAGAGVPTEHVFSACWPRPPQRGRPGRAGSLWPAGGREGGGPHRGPGAAGGGAGEFPAPLLHPEGHRRQACGVPEGQAQDRPGQVQWVRRVCAAVCPMGSVSAEDPSQVNGICIKVPGLREEVPHRRKVL